MIYDLTRAAGYDDLHRDRFAEAGPTAEVLADLHAGVTAARGRSDPVLELGVGTGRVALPLAARGIEVHGIDDSPPMVERLRAKPDGGRVRVVMGDMAEVGSLVAGEYAVAFVVFNTLFELSSQDDQVRCVAGVARHLVPGGLFVVEALAPDLTRLDQALAVTQTDPARVVLHASRHDPVAQTVASQEVVITESGVRLSPSTIRYASVPEIDLMARLAGLRLLHRWGGWQRQPFTAGSSNHVSVYERPTQGSTPPAGSSP